MLIYSVEQNFAPLVTRTPVYYIFREKLIPLIIEAPRLLGTENIATYIEQLIGNSSNDRQSTVKQRHSSFLYNVKNKLWHYLVVQPYAMFNNCIVIDRTFIDII